MPIHRAVVVPLLLSSAAAQGAAPSANERYGDIAGQDALEYAITLRVDLAAQALVGTVDYEFAATATLATVRLDARRSDDWHVTFLTAAGEELAADWGEEQVTLRLPEPVAAGSTLRFSARIAGAPVDGFYFKESRYGELLAFTDHYSIRARGWLPCEDNPADRARFSLVLHYPEGNEAVAYGAASAPPDAAARAPAGYRSVHLHNATPIPPYMFAIVVGPYARVEEEGDPRLRPHLVYAEDVAAARPLLVHHAAWLQRMEQTFGPYPFGKYTTVQCPTRWGGFESPGNVQLAEGLFDNGARGVGTLAHELVHMWFGDGVGYAEWREVWLSEGFASYLGPWLHAAAGGPSLTDSLRAMRGRWLRSFEGRTRSVRDDGFPHPDQALNSNTYPKGAWVLHMLRGELGDDAFFAALKAYYTACRGRSVHTRDFVDAVERSSGEELDWFFAQWLDRVGCPELRVGAEAGKLVVEQVQPGAPYRFWLRLRAADGAEHRVRVEQARQVLDVAGPAAGVELDPRVELLFRPAN